MIVFDKNTQNPLISYGEGSYFGDQQILLNIKSNFRYESFEGKGDTQMFYLKSRVLNGIFDIHETERKFLVTRAYRRYHHLKRVRKESSRHNLQESLKKQYDHVKNFNSE